mmetsp:Transcript_15593/g.44795  ORF Transcript_15593/g.44795 Transcript_15593/m.44795 type:complete len:444 (+) Transcript_15593:144-1475(+)
MARYPPPSLPPPPLSPLTHCEGLEQTNNGSDGDDFDPMYVVGVSLAALSALISSVALLIMKRSADTEAGLPLRPSCTHRWRRLWWLGFLMNTGSEVSLSVVALGMAPISVIAPIFGLAIVFSAVLARLGWVPGVKESLSRAEWASIVVIVVGIGLCSAFGPSTEHEIAFEDIGKFFGRASFLGYACPAAAFVLFWVAVLLPRSPLLWLRPGSRSVTLSICASAASGIAGAFSIVFSKIFSEAIIHRWLGKGDTSVFSDGVTYASVAGIAVCAPAQLWLLNWALGSGKAAYVVPLYTVMIICNNVIQGGLLFDEFTCLAESEYKLAVFVTALLLTVAGVALLSSQQEGARSRGGAASRGGADGSSVGPELSGPSASAFVPFRRSSRRDSASMRLVREVPGSPQAKAAGHFRERGRGIEEIQLRHRNSFDGCSQGSSSFGNLTAV